LRVIEDVERFDSEKQDLRLGGRQALSYGSIEVVRAWTVEEPPLCIPRRAKSVHCKRAGIEVILPILARVVVQVQRTAVVGPNLAKT